MLVASDICCSHACSGEVGQNPPGLLDVTISLEPALALSVPRDVLTQKLADEATLRAHDERFVE